eukprot:3420824-Ditylum_brightwellii.AAC.1
MEHYLLCIKTINTLAKRYKWWTTATNGADLAFETVNRMLSESALDTWEDKCTTRSTINQATFDTNIREHTRSICRKNAFNNQEEYLKNMRKPDDMTMAQWLKRIEAINKVLPLLKPGYQQIPREIKRHISIRFSAKTCLSTSEIC